MQDQVLQICDPTVYVHGDYMEILHRVIALTPSVCRCYVCGDSPVEITGKYALFFFFFTQTNPDEQSNKD